MKGRGPSARTEPLVCHRNKNVNVSCVLYECFFSYPNVKSHVTRAMGIRRLRMFLFFPPRHRHKIEWEVERGRAEGERQESKWHIVRFIHVNMCHFLCSPFAENDEWIKSIFHLSFFLIFRNSGGFSPFCVSVRCRNVQFFIHIWLKKNALLQR